MPDMSEYWEVWAPYWSYIEDNYLDVSSVRKLIPIISEPVLVIGAGQGLLVHDLQKHGLEVNGIDAARQMIAAAKERRGLDLYHATGADMPFRDDKYGTALVATGVIDFIEDQQQIALILKEAFRVTEDAGKVLIAFYKFHPQTERLLKTLGFLEDGVWHYKASLKIFRLGTLEFLNVIKERADVGMLRALMILLKSQLFLSKEDRAIITNWRIVWKLAQEELSSTEPLLKTAPERLPYRDLNQIKGLITDLGYTVQDVVDLHSCYVVQVS